MAEDTEGMAGVTVVGTTEGTGPAMAGVMAGVTAAGVTAAGMAAAMAEGTAGVMEVAMGAGTAGARRAKVLVAASRTATLGVARPS
ncbi:hypothetical protein E2C01_072409 [Portunus trituberculatus]|uniref:Uncharacterized protein n=1 Tax=Portunus trituberculatus TaxID=210409 RepID=A0A5B7HZT1_PORTR|nr:hypothetical protein [Portunus trituberculatus]